MSISCPFPFNMNIENSMFENDPKMSLLQIRAKCNIPDINNLENYGQCKIQKN